MFEHLDPPRLPDPGEDDLSRVKAAALARRRRLVGMGAGGGGLALLLVIAIVASLTSGSGPSRRVSAAGRGSGGSTTTTEGLTTSTSGPASPPAGAEKGLSSRAGSGQRSVARGATPSGPVTKGRHGGILFIGDNGDLEVMNPDGSDRAVIAHPQSDCCGVAGITGARWSPDRNTIAFTGSEKYDSVLWLLNTSSGAVHTFRSGTLAAGFAPDSKQLGLVPGYPRGLPGPITVTNVDGKGERALTDNSLVPDRFPPSWTRDGNRIFFAASPATDFTTTTTASLLPPSGPPQSGPSRLWTVDVAGGKPTRIEGFEGAAEPTVSPDGTRIAFGREDCSAATGTCGRSHVYVADIDGTKVHRVTNDDAVEGNPVWSPDGKRIAYHRDPGQTCSGCQGPEMDVVNADGTDRVRLPAAAAPLDWG